MEQDATVSAALRPPSPQNPNPFDLDDVLQQVSKDDQEEWEYEYSTTETETYYLTLELSYPEFKDAATKAHHHSRGGYYKNWLDQHTGDPNARGTTARPGRPAQSDNDDDDDDEPLPEPEADDDMPLDPVIDKGKGVDTGDKDQSQDKDKEGGNAEGQDEDDEKKKDAKRLESKEDIQILELHSRNPIIAYRGRTFEGEWAEVLGTEAILASRDDNDPSKDPLPALRHLGGDVDVLAASSSRILTREKILKPKVTEQDSLADIKHEWNIKIPTGKDKSGERAQQAHFLESLMALKKKKGHEDDVTVYATAGKGKDFRDRKDPDIKPRRRKAPPGAEETGDGAVRRPRKRPGRPRVARNGRATNAPRGRAAGGGTTSWEMDVSGVGRGALSTPTPSRWTDLPRGGGDGDEDEDEDVDVDDSDDNEAADGDAGEDEDVVMDD